MPACIIQCQEDKIIDTQYIHGLKLVKKLISDVFPRVDNQLSRWTAAATAEEGNPLLEQALASIQLKRFHCLGGSAYALYPGANLEAAVAFITAFQTISDYLDNLCDRMGVEDEAAFRQLHLSMLDAVDPYRAKSDYYSLYPLNNDNGYLDSLVAECRSQVVKLNSFEAASRYFTKYVELYTDLQSLKHLSPDVREGKLLLWAGNKITPDLMISPWEFAAATGSTLGIFLMFAAAFDPGFSDEEAEAIDFAYFPWVCGLHILLDYFIDSGEDAKEGDLNFTNYYETLKVCEERLILFTDRALEACSRLKYSEFHATVIRGLLAMYLSDYKASAGLNKLTANQLLRNAGAKAMLYHVMCKALRASGKL